MEHLWYCDFLLKPKVRPVQILLWPCIWNICNLNWCDEKTIQQRWTQLKNLCHQSEWIPRLQFKQTYDWSQFAGLTICIVDSALPFEITPSDAFCITYVICWFWACYTHWKNKSYGSLLINREGISLIFQELFWGQPFLTDLNERWR